MHARYICFEGTEGVGKTTQTKKLVEHLKSLGYKVLQTKEPGTDLLPLTMTLRGIMLDKQYDDQLTVAAREFISQAIRSIHLEKLVYPSMETYDFIVQDRGILSGLAYGDACGNSQYVLDVLARAAANRPATEWPYSIYDDVIYLKGDVAKHLEVAKAAKQEFSAGDAIEAKGSSFMQTVQTKMDAYSPWFNTKKIGVDGKNIDEVFQEILGVLNIKG